MNAVDYLLKPFDADQLRESLERARVRLANPAGLIEQLRGLIDGRTSAWVRRLVVRTAERFDFVPVDTIDRIESANNYTVLHCRGKDFVFNETLTALESRLDPAQFLRVHRGHIVNLTRIVGVNAITGGAYELELKGRAIVRTGRQYADGVRKLLKR